MEEIRAATRSTNTSETKTKASETLAAKIQQSRGSSSATQNEEQTQIQENSIERVTEQTNSAISRINSQIDNARQAANLNRRSNKEARTLEKLFEQREKQSGDSPDSDIEATIQRLEQLDKERDELERTVASGNSNLSGLQRISSATQQIGEIKANPVELNQRPLRGSEIRSSTDARNFVSQNREENLSLRVQINELRGERQSAVELGSEARKQVRRSVEGDLESLDLRSAEALAQSVAQEIRALGAGLQSGRAGAGNSGAAINPITEVFQSPDPSKIIQKLQT